MISSYQVGYYSGRVFTKMAKCYLLAKVVKRTANTKTMKNLAKKYKINKENPDAITENVFDCLEYVNY